MSDQSWIDYLTRDYKVDENTTFVHDFDAKYQDSDAEIGEVTWSIVDKVGLDGNLFTINEKGELYLKNSLDYENPIGTRYNPKNKYNLEIKVNSVLYPSYYDIHNIYVEVEDVLDTDPISLKITQQPKSYYNEGEEINIKVEGANLPYKLNNKAQISVKAHDESSNYLYDYDIINLKDNLKKRYRGWEYTGERNSLESYPNISSFETTIRTKDSAKQYLQLDGFSDLHIGKILEDKVTEGDETYHVEIKYNDLTITSTPFTIKDSSMGTDTDQVSTYSISDAVFTEGIPGTISLTRTNSVTQVGAVWSGYRSYRNKHYTYYLEDPFSNEGQGYVFNKGESEKYFEFHPAYNEIQDGTRVINHEVTLPITDLTVLHDNVAKITLLDFPFIRNNDYQLEGIKDYDGNLHAGLDNNSKYKYQGFLDVNNDGSKEAIFTNSSNARWVTVEIDSSTASPIYSEHGEGGITRVVGIYNDPLIAIGEANNGFLPDGITPAPANYGVSDQDRYVDLNGDGDFDDNNEDRLALNSQVRFQKDLSNENIELFTSRRSTSRYAINENWSDGYRTSFTEVAIGDGDVDGDGMGEIFWKLKDGSGYLRTIHHFDGNIQYANYMSGEQLVNFLVENFHESMVGTLGLSDYYN